MKYGQLDESHQNAINLRAQKKLVFACIFAVFFMFTEILGGYISGSIAIIADAAHLLSDVAGFLISLIAIWIGRLPASPFFTYGFQRAEVIGAISSVLLIWVLTLWLLFAAFDRLVKDIKHVYREPVDGKLMFIIAIIGLAVNICLMKILGHGHSHGGHSHGAHSHGDHHQHCHGHGVKDISAHKHGEPTSCHNHSHSNHELSCGSPSSGCRTVKRSACVPIDEASARPDVDLVGESTIIIPMEVDLQKPSSKSHVQENINVRAAYVHALGDFVQSVGVCIAGGAIWYNPKWQIIDPMLTMVFSVIVMFTTIPVFKQSLHTLMEGTPADIDFTDIANGLCKLPEVDTIHDLHIWSMTIGAPALSVHITTHQPDKALSAAQSYIMSKGISHSTIQIENSKLAFPQDCLKLNCGQPHAQFAQSV